MKTCIETKANSRSADFTCKLDYNHGEKHIDPVTGIIWSHPHKGPTNYPYGVKKLREAPHSEKGGNRGKSRFWVTRARLGPGMRMIRNSRTGLTMGNV